MRKIFTLIFMTFIITCLFAEDNSISITTRPIALQAGFDKVLSVNVTRIPSQSETYLQGMPFNIEDPQVEYNASEDANGRRIANWSVLANTPFSLSFELEPLTAVNKPNSNEPNSNESNSNESNSNESNSKLPYILTFEYELAYGLNRNDYLKGKFSLDMGSAESPTTTFNNVNITEGVTSEEGSFLGTLDGGVYFMFTKESTENIAKDENGDVYPFGSYKANVTITITEVGQ